MFDNMPVAYGQSCEMNMIMFIVQLAKSFDKCKKILKSVYVPIVLGINTGVLLRFSFWFVISTQKIDLMFKI